MRSRLRLRCGGGVMTAIGFTSVLLAATQVAAQMHGLPAGGETYISDQYDGGDFSQCGPNGGYNSCNGGCYGESCHGCEGCYGEPCQTGNRGCCSGGWVRVDYLSWWSDGAFVPPLVTTSTPNTPQIDAGVLGRPGTSVLFGGDDFGNGRRDGARFTVGTWLDSCQCCGLEASWFSLGDDGDNSFVYSSDQGGSPILARPFFDADPQANEEASELVAFPGLVTGTVRGNLDSDIDSAGILFRTCLSNECCRRTDLLAGYRHFELSESLFISEQLFSIATGGLIPFGTTFDLFDSFDTESEFHGFDVGVLRAYQHCKWTFEGRAKVALGNMHNRVSVNGATLVTVPQTFPVLNAGGLLAQPTNIGTREDDEFAAIPEISLDIRYQLTCHFAATFGYTFIYLDDVLRVANQIDTTVNSTQIGGGTLDGPARPAPLFVTDDVWLNGFNLGVEARW